MKKRATHHQRVCKRCGKTFQSARRGSDWANFCSAACIEAHKVTLGQLQASRLETEFAALLADAGLIGVAQFPLGPFVFDLAFPQVRLLVEVDGELFHTSSAAQERDDRKDAQVRALGWRVQRVPQGIIVQHPQEAVRLVMEAFFSAVPD